MNACLGGCKILVVARSQWWEWSLEPQAWRRRSRCVEVQWRLACQLNFVISCSECTYVQAPTLEICLQSSIPADLVSFPFLALPEAHYAEFHRQPIRVNWRELGVPLRLSRWLAGIDLYRMIALLDWVYATQAKIKHADWGNINRALRLDALSLTTLSKEKKTGHQGKSRRRVPSRNKGSVRNDIEQSNGKTDLELS
jgi:hypothetical protein